MAINKSTAQLAAWTSLLIIFGLTYISSRAWKENQRLKSSVAKLPNIQVRSLDGAEKLLSSIPAGTTKILILFDSNCSSCRAQGHEISYYIKFLNNASIYFLSIEPLDRIAEFRTGLGFDNWENVSFLQIDEEEANEQFGPGPLPGIYIYGKDGMLLRHFRGETKMSAVLNYVIPE